MIKKFGIKKKLKYTYIILFLESVFESQTDSECETLSLLSIDWVILDK